MEHEPQTWSSSLPPIQGKVPVPSEWQASPLHYTDLEWYVLCRRSVVFYVVVLFLFWSKLFKSSIYFLKLSFLYLKVYLNVLHEIIFRFTSMYFRMTNVFPVPVGRSMRQFFPLRAEDRSSSWYSRRVTSPVGPAGTGITEPSLIMSFAETIKLSSFDSDVTTEPLSSECSAGTEIKC